MQYNSEFFLIQKLGTFENFFADHKVKSVPELVCARPSEHARFFPYLHCCTAKTANIFSLCLYLLHQPSPSYGVSPGMVNRLPADNLANPQSRTRVKILFHSLFQYISCCTCLLREHSPLSLQSITNTMTGKNTFQPELKM